MPGILTAIQEQMDTMNRKEKEIAAYVLAHAQNIVHMGITELSQQSGGSTATISRFCKQFHFSGFTEFKLKLAAELALEPAAQSYQDIVAGNPLPSIVSAMEANHVRSITDTTRMLDMKQLHKAIEALKSARQIDLYGVATSGLVAQDFYQKLVRIGKRAVTFSDPHMQVTSASNLTDRDVAIGISYSGETAETIAALKCAAENGATTISLTKFGANTLTSLASISLFTSTLEEGMRRGDMASRIAQLHVIDILFVGLVSEQFDDLVPRLENSFQMVKKYR
ncbi:MurR/RpiR family transcriptional regulator [Paenibacillus doosanensis]|uniref:HTH-type transcriptional regulator YbbH n=1 Tax=Paenibacillus konkukensis TaxID=2020716 RepID=A0ABY4RRR7_9BACL|nr:MULTISPECIES: MurR/RpiR family transcriptional regulator [Paenibacillus]MCS7463743.1 MurR/RpiR family transcriptional regulator [Paenibacillus doosanensis]UQZ85239.1 putative HTH-type transcriptional regulator YbbH [Paenibacillus konkukensis]